MTKKPIQTFKLGGLELAFWENDGENGTWLGASISRRYRDNEEWKTESFHPSAVELANLSKLAGRGADFLLEQGARQPADSTT